MDCISMIFPFSNLLLKFLFVLIIYLFIYFFGPLRARIETMSSISEKPAMQPKSNWDSRNGFNSVHE